MKTPIAWHWSKSRKRSDNFCSLRCVQRDKSSSATKAMRQSIIYVPCCLFHEADFAATCVNRDGGVWHFTVAYCPRCEVASLPSPESEDRTIELW
jgi:hypothetical protein